MSSKFIFLILILLTSSSVFAKEPSLNWNAIRYLEGRNTFYDGPNCYNATFVAKGWTTIVSQTADEELKYYLWHFCEKNKKGPKPGDILVHTAGEDRHTMHSAAYLGRGQIFEKLSFLGLYGKFANAKEIGTYDGDLKRESTFEIRSIKKSDYFKENRQDYQCKPLSEINRRLTSFQQTPEFAAIQEAKRLLSVLSFSRLPKKRPEFRELPEAINKVSEIIEHMSGETDQDLFLYAGIESINSHFYNFIDGLRKLPRSWDGPDKIPKLDYETENDRFQMSLRCLIARIKNARPGPETDFIVRDTPEKAYWVPLKCLNSGIK